MFTLKERRDKKIALTTERLKELKSEGANGRGDGKMTKESRDAERDIPITMGAIISS